MSEAKKNSQENLEEEVLEQEVPQEEAVVEETVDSELENLKKMVALQEDKYLRLAAEYENYRRRTAKEKEAIWADAKGDAAAAFLPVYDNLERAVNQPTADEAYKKGVELTMNGLLSILEGLGVKAFGEVGDPFDPNYHNAVMQREDENFGESTICEVFQTGYKLGEKVIRHAMVVVAN